MAGSALAADLPSRKAPVIAPPPPPMWTGFHVGLNAGGTWGNNSSLNSTTWSLAPPSGFPAIDNSNIVNAALLTGTAGQAAGSAGFIGGGQVGYDWQVPVSGYGVVVGGEADFQGIAGTGGNGSRWIGAQAGTFLNNSLFTLSNQQVSGSLQWLGTVRGRVGFLAMPTLLVYGTGGLAYGGVSGSVQNTQNGLLGNAPSIFNYGSGSYSKTAVGWTAGGGLEWMFMPNWSAKAEYLYYDLGNVSGSVYNTSYGLGVGTTTQLASVSNYSARVSGNIVRAGVNYHFNWGSAPVVAKY